MSSNCSCQQAREDGSGVRRPLRPGALAVISGPSGVGKSTVCNRVRQRLRAKLSVSATTRGKTKDEIDGRDYYFLSHEEFRRRIDNGEFLEHAQYLGHMYGTPARPVRQALADGQDVLLEIEVQGGVQVAKAVPEAVLIFLLPPEQEVLTERITGRGRDSAQAIRQRLANAEEEIQVARQSGMYQHFVINNVLDETVEKIVGIIETHAAGPAGQTT